MFGKQRRCYTSFVVSDLLRGGRLGNCNLALAERFSPGAWVALGGVRRPQAGQVRKKRSRPHTCAATRQVSSF